MMPKKNKQYLLLASIAGGVIVIDQIIKVLVKTNMQLYETIPVLGSWFQLHFVENEGMAFGMAFGGSLGKLILSLFRLLAASFILYYLVRQIKRDKMSTGIVISLSLIFAGAVGNLIDCAFYGLIFNDSAYHVAQLFPPSGGYGTFLHGRVVDMFYFPLIDTVLPNWFPIWGGQRFVFFNAVFNFADAAITIGVIWLIAIAYFSGKKTSKSSEEAES